jgi:hypothetical protein
MSNIYDRQLNVLPFFILPDGNTQEEASIAFASVLLTKQSRKRSQKTLLDTLYSPIESKICCPIISQVISYDYGVLLSTTIRTEVLNRQTNREGLYFTYGAFVKNDVFLLKTSVCTTIFDLLDTYIQSFDNLTVIEAVNKIVTEFQFPSNSHEIYFSYKDTQKLLNYFESHFCFTDRKKINFITKTIISTKQSKTLKQPWLKPSVEFEQIKEFWMYVDGQLSL